MAAKMSRKTLSSYDFSNIDAELEKILASSAADATADGEPPDQAHAASTSPCFATLFFSDTSNSETMPKSEQQTDDTEWRKLARRLERKEAAIAEKDAQTTMQLQLLELFGDQHPPNIINRTLKEHRYVFFWSIKKREFLSL